MDARRHPLLAAAFGSGGGTALPPVAAVTATLAERESVCYGGH